MVLVVVPALCTSTRLLSASSLLLLTLPLRFLLTLTLEVLRELMDRLLGDRQILE